MKEGERKEGERKRREEGKERRSSTEETAGLRIRTKILLCVLL